ncbi:MAG: SDR family NAD(P)-dependent oxidoreductase [Desulfobacterota bacterium]|jgi:3-hydroxy-3-methylglutaryl CoA synthase/NAD(P)-dependent dehydrogenase (short-subunit alcohol dehydrogenase family)/putative sterol carrier protein|nr:SDR family NAD(P)-dependent oxidoreductase [Thermodesulfobacteriota bacterium]
MIGITSYGGYIPRLRLNRMSIFQEMGWFAPAIVMVAQGERSFCNWDEDSLTMAVAASQDCLRGLDQSRVEALFLASTTLPFADRGNAGIVKTALNLRDDLLVQDMTSSQRAGTGALLTALGSLRDRPGGEILVTAADKRETKGAYFYEMWFGDGAASLLVGREKVIAEFLGSHSLALDFVDHYRGARNQYDYMWEERWVRDEGYAKIIPAAVEGLFEKLGISMDDVDRFVFPCFFKAEHRAIARKLGAAPEKVQDNLHEEIGETGAAHPLVMFVRTLEQARPGDRILLAGFGQGCDALYFRVTENIRDLPARTGISGSLKNKKTIDNYPKFLKFRDLIQTEMGIRAEAPTQTAMTVLWRKRQMILGLTGGRCTACGTPQFPKMDICVNPDCRQIRTQEDYAFAGKPAFIKTFTGDLLTVSVDPPAVYGMIQFEEGGRFMADFTDCELADVWVGQPVRLSFRRRYTDRDRGFTGYFWKAIPLPVPRPREEHQAAGIRFAGRVAVVTGAGAGLGRAYALELAARGAKVVVNDLGGARDGSGDGSAGPADRVAAEIREAGGEAVANYDSVSTPEGGEALIHQAIETFGRVDILINNAGILRDKSLLKMTPEEWQKVLAVHLDGAYYVTRPAFQRMRDQKYGRVILTTSAAGLFGNFGQANYSAAKLALLGLMNTLKLEGEKYDIKVNTVAPVAATRLTEDILPPDLFERLKPEFVTPLVLYLSSEQCGETGQVFNAGLGYFNKAAVVTGPGTMIGDGRTVPTPEDIERHWEAINALTGAKEYFNTTLAFGDMLLGGNSASETAVPALEGPDVAAVFTGLPQAFRADKAAGVDVIFQFRISGPGGGDWFAVIRDGACTVTAGQHEKPTTTIRMADGDFLNLMSGKLPAMQAFTAGKLKIEGDLMKSQLIEKLFKF